MSRRILFVHNHPTRFVQIDLALLRERYDVREWYQRGRLIHVPELARAVRQSDLVFGWFASWHTFSPLLLARAIRRPAILVIGGYDTANMPEIGYGHQRGGLRRWIACRTMHLASALVTNSCYAKDEAVGNAGVESSRVTVIYHGLPDQVVDGNEKQGLVITAGNVDRANLSRKGLEAFTRAASLLPMIRFVLIGAWRDNAVNYLRSLASPNVQFTGWLCDQEMSDYFARAMVYVQASRHEAFGMAVAEAMQRGCIPVVTQAGGLPELVGGAGIYITTPEPAAIAEGIGRAFAAGGQLGKRAGERVRREFHLERRRQRLLDLIEGILDYAGNEPNSLSSRT